MLSDKTKEIRNNQTNMLKILTKEERPTESHKVQSCPCFDAIVNVIQQHSLLCVYRVQGRLSSVELFEFVAILSGELGERKGGLLRRKGLTFDVGSCMLRTLWFWSVSNFVYAFSSKVPVLPPLDSNPPTNTDRIQQVLDPAAWAHTWIVTVPFVRKVHRRSHLS